MRTIPLYGRAMDKQGFSNNSATITLKVDRNTTAKTDGTRLGTNVTLPTNTQWTKDELTQTSWTAWFNSKNTTLRADQSTTYFVAAQNQTGLGRVELYTNGDLKRTCDFTSSLDIRVCSLEIMGKDYPANAEIFVNGRIFTSQDSEAQVAWVTGARVPRDGSINGTVNAATVPAANTAQKFVTVTLNPDTTAVKHGARVIAQVRAQNNIDGVNNVEVFVNNEMKRFCAVGNVTTATTCDVEIDTSAYPAGTSVSVYARMRDGGYQLNWSNTRALWIGDARAPSTPDLSQNKMSVWTWMAPITAELGAGQKLNYSVGAWSADNVQRIEMVVDDIIRKTCSYGNTSGNKECALTLADADFADRHIAVFNARVIDHAGNKGWSDVRSVKIVREWLAMGMSLPSTLTIEHDRTEGYVAGDRVSFVARAWSASTVERIEIYANGQVAMTCPGDVCRWTSPTLTSSQLEYQARAIDTVGRSTWTGVMGVSQK